jgi:hypothetical protein
MAEHLSGTTLLYQIPAKTEIFNYIKAYPSLNMMKFSQTI